MKTLRIAHVAALALLISTSIACGDRSAPSQGPNDQRPDQSQVQPQVHANADVDQTQAPTIAEAAGPRGDAYLRSDQVRTRHLMNGTVTAGKLGYVAVTVNVSAAAATGSSAANPDLVGGILFSCDPSGNQDQLQDNAVLNGDGSITVTLAAAATAQNNFRCMVLKASAKGTT